MKLGLVVLTGMVMGAVAPTDARLEEAVETNTPFFAGRFAGWPGGMTRGAWEKRKAELRQQILVAAGLEPLPGKREAPRARYYGKKEYDGFSVEKVMIETSPNYWLGGNLFRPVGGEGKRPAIVSPHGHWKNGRAEQTELGNIPARGAMLARMGFVVLNYDMVGYNDTKQTPHSFGEALWNWGPMGLQLWNSIRVVDYLQSLGDVDGGRIGATGASGGGTQTFLLAAVDERIRWSAPVNMISGIMQGGSPCENAPGLRVGTFNVELAAMMAPRPMLMVAATGDWTRETPRKEFPAMRSLYGLFDAAPLVESVQITAPHNYNRASREAVYDFFARRALGLAAGPKEYGIPEFTDLLVGSVPEGALDYEGVFRQFRSAVSAVPASKERLRAALLAEWPDSVESSIGSDGRFVLTRTGRGDRVEGRVIEGKGPGVLVVSPRGVAASVSGLEGRRVVLLEPFKGRAETGRYYSTFQKTEAAERVQDILTALRWMGEGTEVLGLEEGAVWAAVAGAAAPVSPRMLGDVGTFQGTDAEWMRVLPAPGIQWAGGWRAVLGLLR